MDLFDILTIDDELEYIGNDVTLLYSKHSKYKIDAIGLNSIGLEGSICGAWRQDINVHFKLLPIGATHYFDGTPIFSGHAPSAFASIPNVNVGILTKIHDKCRTCGTNGSHNVVNHKEYYYCVKCKKEC